MKRGAQASPPGSRIAVLFCAWVCASCANPAGSVQVPTMSMREALSRSRSGESLPAPSPVPARASSVVGGAPQPLVSAPEVRMAWLYEWVDTSGNRHFGGWVAIPLRGFGWVMGDGSEQAIGPQEALPGSAP